MGKINLAQACVTRTAMNPNEDDAIFTSHWRRTAAVEPDTDPMDHGNRVEVTTKLKTFWTTIQANVTNKAVLREVRWYDVPDAAPHKPVFIESIAVVSGGATGSGNPLPPQVACSVTFRTDSRKHWGRFYVPCLVSSVLDSGGNFQSTFVDEVATAAKNLCARGGVAGTALTVWSPTTGARNDPQTVSVDDIPDVIRRRRFSTKRYSKTLTV